MEETMVNTESENTRELYLIDGESRNVKSPYYQRLVQYTRSLIRALNGANVTPDLETYCYHQMWLTRVEMNKYREAFLRTFQPEHTPDGPNAS